ncbi:hypothetical protein COOONC_02839 [Cooperia oncophora]
MTSLSSFSIRIKGEKLSSYGIVANQLPHLFYFQSKPSPAQSSCGGVPRKRKSNGFRKTEETVRKSVRITRTCDPSAADFVDNYVDSKRLKQPRIVQPPKGAKRIPNVMPRNKGAKEKDKLSIDMVGPRTRSSLVELISPLGGTRRRNVHVELTAKIGPDHQATFEPFYASDFAAPSISSVDEEPDRDELIWHLEPSGSTSYSSEELDDAWSAIRCQYGGTIGLDSMLYCLMKHNYNIDAMLENIEVEQWRNLSQPFEELNIAQQKEFERVLRDLKGKNFGAIQDKFVSYCLERLARSYPFINLHSDETILLFNTIINQSDALAFMSVIRVVCAGKVPSILTLRYYFPNEHFLFRRNGCHRNVVGKLFEMDEKVVKRWVELEKDNKRTMSSAEVCYRSLFSCY